ncbi:MAG: ATP synthase F1 subunit delta [Ignavibacteria bacterium]|nr:MAG: ATP synthase F1 subunit delta [Ignavibacteria bacterium]
MSTLRFATRYAEAILDAIPADSSPETVIAELQDVQASVEASRELRLFFESPVIATDTKAEAVKALFQDRVSPYVVSVLLLLVEKRRESAVLAIITQVLVLRRAREGVLTTTVSSAVELDDGQRATLINALETTSGKRIEAEYAVDPDLVGGLIVRMGDTVYDGSVQHQLKRLRDRFVTGR